MKSQTLILLLAVTVVAAGVATARTPPSPAPLPYEVATRAIVATATLGPTNRTLSNARGTVKLIIPRSDKSMTIIVNVTLTGGLTNITMAHIHLANASAGNPIVVFLQPRMNFTARPVLLDPPVTYKGTYSFLSSYNIDNIATITPGWDLWGLRNRLADGLLYVNVHTTSQPGGALRGNLTCELPCIWPVCSLPDGSPC